MIYKCHKCSKTFKQKGHYENHLRRKNTCQRCDRNFKTDYAYINGEPIHVSDYVNCSNKRRNEIRCSKGHTLVLVNGASRRSHFRHKRSCDVTHNGAPMTSWHIEWQRKFPLTEVWYRRKEGQIKDRRADIVVEGHNMVIEVEHSGKTVEEVVCKDKDYRLHNMGLIWIVDGNTDDVRSERLSNGQFIISFGESWKYKAFSHTCDFILLDIRGDIFKIPVKKVTAAMIKVKESKPLDVVVSKLLTNPKKVWDLWEDDNSCKCLTILWQKGAGCGKTWGLWEQVIKNPDKDTFFILVTKHSEKTVILEELKAQQRREEFHIQENIHRRDEEDGYIEGIPDDDGLTDPRQYVLAYTHKMSGRKVTIIVATVASFYYNLTMMSHNCSDPYSTLVPNFLREGAIKVKPDGAFRFAGGTRVLNKKTQIWFDEAQDLAKEHLSAMTKLILSYAVDIGVVGDKLQSLQHEENILTTLFTIEIPDTQVQSLTPGNRNRRIRVRGLAEEINKVVNFKKFDLPEISIEDEGKLDKKEVKEPLELLLGFSTMYANDRSTANVKKVELFCDKIIEKFEKEIEAHNYVPQDFMIISPVIAGRTELPQLVTRLENMWIRKFNDGAYVERITDNYWKENNHSQLGRPVHYVQLHKSEDGRAIRLAESSHKTRIVSTVTSKGDGRNVVFCLNITEKTLRLVAGNKLELRYESHLHVPLTRAMRKVYFQLTENGDDIHRRFRSRDGVHFVPEVKKYLRVAQIGPYIDEAKVQRLFGDNGVEYNEEGVNSAKERIDFTDHCSRRAIWKTLLHFHLNKRVGPCYRSYEALGKIEDVVILPVKKYWKLLNSRSTPIESLPVIPLIDYDNKFYKGFAKEIRGRMMKLKEKINAHVWGESRKLLALTEIDYICLSYMILINRYWNKAPFNINNLYSVINRINNNENIDIQTFYGKIKPVETTCNNMIDDIEKKYGRMKWNIEHAVNFEGKTSDFSIRKQESVIIGHNKEHVADVVIRTTLGKDDYFKAMTGALLDRFVLYSPEQKTAESKNKERFANKQLVTYVLVLDTSTYKEFAWNWDKCVAIKDIVKEGVENYFSACHSQLFDYCNKICTRWNTDEQLREIKISPFEYITRKLKDKASAPYIIRFIDYLANKFQIDRINTKMIINDKDLFLEEVERCLKRSVDGFFDEVEFIF